MATNISASFTVSLGGNSSDSAKAEVCESNIIPGSEAHIKVYPPPNYKVVRILNTMEGIGGCKITPMAKTVQIEQKDELTFTDKEREQTLGFYPDTSVAPVITWVGNSLGEISITGNKATLIGLNTEICAAKSASDNLVSARGLVRITYKTIATIYTLYTPPLSALTKFGDAPYPMAIEFQLERI